MKQNHIIYIILVFGIISAITVPHITNKIYNQGNESYVAENENVLASTTETVNSTSKVATNASNVELAIATPEVKEEPTPVETKVQEPIKQEPKEEPTVLTAPKSYNEMTTEEMINAINNGTFTLEYSKSYDINTNKLSKAKGALYYNNHKETYYSQNVLPGNSLKIPGRHVAEDGTVRDADGYISVAANSSYLSKGTVVKTSLGPGKVYDCGCASGVIDIYTNW